MKPASRFCLLMFRAPRPFCIVLPSSVLSLRQWSLFSLHPFFVFHSANEGLPWSRDFYLLLISIGGGCAPALLIQSWGQVAWALLGMGVDHPDAYHTPPHRVCVSVCPSHSNPFSPLGSVLTDSLLESAGHRGPLISLIGRRLRIPGIGCDFLGSPLIWQRTIGSSQNQSF